MSRWVYRPCKIVHPDGNETWDIRSFYYDEQERPRGWSQQSSYPFGESLSELKEDLKKMIEGVLFEKQLTLYVYKCTECGETDARTEKERTVCPTCLKEENNE